MSHIFAYFFIAYFLIILFLDLTSKLREVDEITIKFGLSHISRILIGNKIDLKDERKIILPIAEHLSEKLNAPYLETSALTGENVKFVFNKIAQLVYESKAS